jgi:hypothetical protein
MWSNSVGAPFVLHPKHAAVFRKAAACFSEYADVLEDAGVAETVFERLTRGQKQLAILLVARALLDPVSEPPAITAALAGTVAAIYDYLQTMIDLEIDHGEETTIRRMVLAALDEMNYWQDQRPRKIPLSANCEDINEWAEVVDALGDRVLVDRDFDTESLFLDAPPEESAALKAHLHIDPDYFVTPIDDPSPQYLEQIRQVLWSLLSQD